MFFPLYSYSNSSERDVLHETNILQPEIPLSPSSEPRYPEPTLEVQDLTPFTWAGALSKQSPNRSEPIPGPACSPAAPTCAPPPSAHNASEEPRAAFPRHAQPPPRSWRSDAGGPPRVPALGPAGGHPYRAGAASPPWPPSRRPPAGSYRSSCSSPPPPCPRRSACSPSRQGLRTSPRGEAGSGGLRRGAEEGGSRARPLSFSLFPHLKRSGGAGSAHNVYLTRK